MLLPISFFPQLNATKREEKENERNKGSIIIIVGVQTMSAQTFATVAHKNQFTSQEEEKKRQNGNEQHRNVKPIE